MLQIHVIYLGLFLILPLPLAHSGQNSPARRKEIILHDFAGANERPPTDPKVFEKRQPRRCNLDTFYWCNFVD